MPFHSSLLAEWSKSLDEELATWVKPQIGEIELPIPERHVQCRGTVAFKCSLGHHEKRDCPHCSLQWKAALQARTHHSYHLKDEAPSLQKLAEKVEW